MERLHRKERVAAILKILSDNPNKVFSLGYFSEVFNAARSTLSEDIVIVKRVVEEIKCGLVETIPGAAGGVKYKPGIGYKDVAEFINVLIKMLKEKERIIPGGYLYMNDLIYSPEISGKIGMILAQEFQQNMPDYVITVETKGIPIAMMTARYLNVPLVIVRRDSRVTEGSTVSINYVTGSSSKRIQTMSLSKRSVNPNSKCIFVDDFMKAGGTAIGIMELMKEFNCTVTGIGVVIETQSEKKKNVGDYVSLLKLEGIDEDNGITNVTISDYFAKRI